MTKKIKMRVCTRGSINDVVYEVDDANSLPYVSEETKRFLNSEAFLGSLDPRIYVGDEDVIIEFTITPGNGR